MYSKQERKKRRASRSHYRKRGKASFRLLVHRSNCNFYAQLIDDGLAHTVYSVSTLAKELNMSKDKRSLNSGKVLKLAEYFVSNIPDAYRGAKIVLDNGSSKYHGLVKLFDEKVRECFNH